MAISPSISYIASLAREKISREAIKVSPNLRKLVGNCNTIDTLLLDNEQDDDGWATPVNDHLVLGSNSQSTALYCTNPDEDGSEDDDEDDDGDFPRTDLGLAPLHPENEFTELSSFSVLHHHKVCVSEQALPYGLDDTLDDTDDDTSEDDDPIFSEGPDDDGFSTENPDSDEEDDEPSTDDADNCLFPCELDGFDGT